jgi:hypothetical protein
MTARRRLLARGMSFRPDLVIANGDHIYWDMKTSQNKPTAAFAREQLWTKVGGPLDLWVPMPPDTYGTLGAERTGWDSNRLSGPKLLDVNRLLHCRMGWLGGRDSTPTVCDHQPLNHFPSQVSPERLIRRQVQHERPATGRLGAELTVSLED